MKDAVSFYLEWEWVDWAHYNDNGIFLKYIFAILIFPICKPAKAERKKIGDSVSSALEHQQSEQVELDEIKITFIYSKLSKIIRYCQFLYALLLHICMRQGELDFQDNPAHDKHSKKRQSIIIKNTLICV